MGAAGALGERRRCRVSRGWGHAGKASGCGGPRAVWHEKRRYKRTKARADCRVPVRMRRKHASQERFYISPYRKAHSDGDTCGARRSSAVAWYGIDLYGKCECARRARGECAPLGKRRTTDVRFAHWRGSLLGSRGFLPATAWRRL